MPSQDGRGAAKGAAKAASLPVVVALDNGYRFIQAGIAAISFVVPIATLMLARFRDGLTMDSISSTYYTAGRNVLVGGLTGLGLLFAAYYRRGRPAGAKNEQVAKEYRTDKALALLGGAAAIVVAMVPTDSCRNQRNPGPCPAPWDEGGRLPFLHAAGTAVLMVVVALFCLRQFVTSRSRHEEDRPKGFFPLAFFVPRDRALTIERRRADIVYRVCGAVVLVCVGTIVWLGVVDLFIDGAGEKKRVGIVELIAFWAFALAWLTKSDFLEWSPLPRPGRCLVQREGRFARFVTWIAETARKVARALRWIC